MKDIQPLLSAGTVRKIERALREASSLNPGMPIPHNKACAVQAFAAEAEDAIRDERQDDLAAVLFAFNDDRLEGFASPSFTRQHLMALLEELPAAARGLAMHTLAKDIFEDQSADELLAGANALN